MNGPRNTIFENENKECLKNDIVTYIENRDARLRNKGISGCSDRKKEAKNKNIVSEIRNEQLVASAQMNKRVSGDPRSFKKY